MAKGTISIGSLCLVASSASKKNKGKTRGLVENTYTSCTRCYSSVSWNSRHFLKFPPLVPLLLPLSCPTPLVLSGLDILSPSQCWSPTGSEQDVYRALTNWQGL